MTESMLSREDRRTLLKIAREAIEVYAREGKVPPLPSPLPKSLQQVQGAFVTLHKKGMLRGCIGNFIGEDSLARTVQKMAVAAGWEDPRFPRLKEKELGQVDIEISALSPLREISDPGEVEPGKHGVFITRGLQRGVLLPQVCTEQGWDRDAFLSHTCLKAGLPPDAWKDGDCRIEVFSAEVFGELEEPHPQ